jgi:hypothetical protein
MSWEAYRWTAKSPSELFRILGPQGVDTLVREALNYCWRELPEETRTLADGLAAAREVLARNVRVWNRIKKPDPAAFFQDLQPKPADQSLRQAMVTCWMMMPRTGGRRVSDVSRIVSHMFERNLAAWEEDHATLTAGQKKKKAAKKPAKAKKAPKAKATKKKATKKR